MPTDNFHPSTLYAHRPAGISLPATIWAPLSVWSSLRSVSYLILVLYLFVINLTCITTFVNQLVLLNFQLFYYYNWPMISIMPVPSSNLLSYFPQFSFHLLLYNLANTSINLSFSSGFAKCPFIPALSDSSLSSTNAFADNA